MTANRKITVMLDTGDSESMMVEPGGSQSYMDAGKFMVMDRFPAYTGRVWIDASVEGVGRIWEYYFYV